MLPLVAAAPSIISGLSSMFGASKQRKAQKELQNYQRSLRLDPVTGQFGQFGVNEGSVDAGSFGTLQDMFSGGAESILGGIDFGGGLPPGVAEALSMVQSRLDPSNPMFAGVQQRAGQAGALGDQAFGDVAAGGGGQGALIQQLFAGASGLAGQLGQSFDQTRDSTLATLRSQALPEQQRAVDSTLSRLFAQGRLGSTGGANIIGRLSEAQNQQDLGFQLAAGDEARAASADTQGRFGTLFSGGQSALQAAFARFAGADSIGGGAFDRAQGLDQEGFSRLTQNLAAETGAAGLPTALQSGRVGLAQNLMGGASSIQDMIMQAFGGAQSLAQAKTNVRVAGAGLNTSTMNSPGYSASPVADAFASLGAGASRPGSIDLASIFAKLGQKTTPTDPSSVFSSLGIPTG